MTGSKEEIVNDKERILKKIIALFLLPFYLGKSSIIERKKSFRYASCEYDIHIVHKHYSAVSYLLIWFTQPLHHVQDVTQGQFFFFKWIQLVLIQSFPSPRPITLAKL